MRVEARRSRSKLERYYQTEGREDQVVIQFRKGSYVPMLLTRDQMKSLGIGDDYGARTEVRQYRCVLFFKSRSRFRVGALLFRPD